MKNTHSFSPDFCNIGGDPRKAHDQEMMNKAGSEWNSPLKMEKDTFSNAIDFNDNYN